MLKNNIAAMHSAKLIFDTIDEVRNYNYFSNLDAGDCIVVLGNIALGDGLCQIRKIEENDDTAHTGIHLKDNRYATLMYDIKLSNEGAAVEKTITLSDFFLPNAASNKIPLTGLTTEDLSNAKEIILYSKSELGKSVGICPMTIVPVPAELKTGVIINLIGCSGVSESDGAVSIPAFIKIDGNNNLNYQLVTEKEKEFIKDTIVNLTANKNITIVVR